jgi:hypothetical protein
VVDVLMTSGDIWKFDVFPQAARVMKRCYRQWGNK